MKWTCSLVINNVIRLVIKFAWRQYIFNYLYFYKIASLSHSLREEIRNHEGRALSDKV